MPLLSPQMRPQGPWAAGSAALLLLIAVLTADALLSSRGRKKVVHVMGEWGQGSMRGPELDPWDGMSHSHWAVGFNIH